MMKSTFKNSKIIFGCFFSVLLAFFSFLFYIHNNQVTVVKHVTDTTDVKIVGDYLVEADLIKAPYILEGTVKNISNSFEYGGIDFVKISFEINDILYSKSELENDILILREKEMFTLPKQGEKYILYLYDYQGPIASNVKMICGGNLGMKEIVIQEKDKNNMEINEYKEQIKKALKY